MKKTLWIVLGLMLAAPAAFASSLRIDLNGGERYLNECGGTIEAKSNEMQQGQDDQINLVLRNVKNCSNFILKTTGQEYKIPGPNGDRTGSFTLSAGRLDFGWNKVALTVRSNSAAHQDDVSIWINIVPKPAPREDYRACYSAAKRAAQNASRFYGDAYATYLRTSNKGNYVYSVDVVGSYSKQTYEVVTSKDCDVLSVK